MKHPLDFKNKFWEKYGLVTDTHGDWWNYGFIDGFNHAVYTFVVSTITYFLFGKIGLIVSSILLILLFIGLEFYQAYNMRHKHPIWYNPLKWYRGRYQDIGFPAIVIMLFWLVI